MFDLVGDGGLKVVDGESAIFRQEVLGGLAFGGKTRQIGRRGEGDERPVKDMGLMWCDSS